MRRVDKIFVALSVVALLYFVFLSTFSGWPEKIRNSEFVDMMIAFLTVPMYVFVFTMLLLSCFRLFKKDKNYWLVLIINLVSAVFITIKLLEN